MTADRSPAGPDIHTNQGQYLTLSEALARTPARPSTDNPPPERGPALDITARAAALPPAVRAAAEAIAQHLSPRAGNASLRDDLRLGYVLLALDHAAACPICAYTGAIADAAGDFVEGVDYAIGAPTGRCSRIDYVTDRRCAADADHDGSHRLPDGTAFGIGYTAADAAGWPDR